MWIESWPFIWTSRSPMYRQSRLRIASEWLKEGGELVKEGRFMISRMRTRERVGTSEQLHGRAYYEFHIGLWSNYCTVDETSRVKFNSLDEIEEMKHSFYLNKKLKLDTSVGDGSNYPTEIPLDTVYLISITSTNPSEPPSHPSNPYPQGAGSRHPTLSNLLVSRHAGWRNLDILRTCVKLIRLKVRPKRFVGFLYKIVVNVSKLTVVDRFLYEWGSHRS